MQLGHGVPRDVAAILARKCHRRKRAGLQTAENELARPINSNTLVVFTTPPLSQTGRAAPGCHGRTLVAI
jgi:hypothetical protein